MTQILQPTTYPNLSLSTKLEVFILRSLSPRLSPNALFTDHCEIRFTADLVDTGSQPSFDDSLSMPPTHEGLAMY